MPIAKAIKQPIAKAILQPIAGSSSASPLLTGLVAYWNLSESSGTRADSHTNGYDLTDVNSVGTTTGPGGSGTAANVIQANNERLNNNADVQSISPGENSFSLSTWVKPDSGANLFVQGYTPDPDGGWALTVNTFSSGRLNILIEDNAANSISALSTGAGFDITGQWIHIVVIVDRATDTLSLYVDGVAQAFFSSGEDISALTGSVVSRSVRYFGFAESGFNTSSSDGAFMATGYWHRALTASEVTTLYNSGTPLLYADL